MRDSNSTTYMLIVVVTIFLMVEIPLAVTTLIHVLANMSLIGFADESYRYLQLTLIITNFIIMLSFPLNFAIYCGMSQQFRTTFYQLFVQKLLAQNNRQTTETTNHITHMWSTKVFDRKQFLIFLSIRQKINLMKHLFLRTSIDTKTYLNAKPALKMKSSGTDKWAYSLDCSSLTCSSSFCYITMIIYVITMFIII